jgi:hypothetical protein
MDARPCYTLTFLAPQTRGPASTTNPGCSWPSPAWQHEPITAVPTAVAGRSPLLRWLEQPCKQRAVRLTVPPALPRIKQEYSALFLLNDWHKR